MDGSFLQELKKIVDEAHGVEIDGQLFSPLTMKRIYDDPRPEPLTVHSLTGVLDYLASEIDLGHYTGLNLAVHVVNHQTVNLIDSVHGQSVQRDVFVKAIYDGPADFHFNTWLDPETFIIGLQSQFVATQESADLLQFVSKLSLKQEGAMEDDGITQKVSMKRGVSGAVIEKGAAPGRVTLQPYRTFSEVEQPEQTFRFRVRASERSIECALYEADGGAWKQAARHLIAEWFEAQLENQIPVIA